MILVTGGAGFIGSNIVAELEANGIGPIAVVDRYGRDERWRNLVKRSVDLYLTPDDLDGWLEANGKSITSIIHMGAISATTERNVYDLVVNNINLSVKLWDCCTAHEIPFIYASSAATYGGIESGFVDDDELQMLSALRPLNAYGWSKKATDIIFARRVAEGLPRPPLWVSLKFFNVYGPNEYHKDDMVSVVCKLYNQVMQGQRVKLFKSHRPGILDGEQKRDFIYVKDCAKTVLWLLEQAKQSGIYNVGSGEARSFLEIVNALSRVLNKHIETEFIDMPAAVRDRYQYFTKADMNKLRRSGMTEPFATLEDGVADYVTQYLSREDRYR